MSRNIGSHTFTNTSNGSLIHIDVGLHEDIDYDFFDSADDPKTESKSKSRKDCHTIKEEKISGKNTNKTFKDCDVIIEEEKEVDISGRTTNKSCDGRSSKIVETAIVEEVPSKEHMEAVVRFSTPEASEKENKRTMEIVSPKQDKSSKLKDLMNCIAYGDKKEEDDEDDDDDVVSNKIKSQSPDFLSLSTDTTSEITDVTTRPTSSGCSSMSKGESEDHLLHVCSKEVNSKKSNTKMQQNDDSLGGSSMKILLDALDTFDKSERKSISSSILSTGRRKFRKRNMSFSNDQCKKIDRENEILLKKLENLRKPKPKPPVPMIAPRLTSSAINRRRQQAKIDHENMILLRKIEQAKPSARIAMSSLKKCY